MWLKNFVDFMEGPAQDVGYQSPLVCGERSRRVWIGGFSWSILAARCESLKKYGPPCFGYFVRCHGDGGNEDWSCDAECTLKIVAHQPEKNKLTMKFTQNFAATSKMKAWGFVSFGEYEVSSEKFLCPMAYRTSAHGLRVQCPALLRILLPESLS